MARSARPQRTAHHAEPGLEDPVLPSETRAFWLQLAALGAAMMIGFVGWFLHVTDKRPDARTAMVQSSNAIGKPLVAEENASPPAPLPPVATVRGALPEPLPEERPDPRVQAVENFYRALAAADGRSAAAFIVPTKRGIGPFNEANISKFYGAFRQPLRIRSIRSTDDGLVEARYSYRYSTTTCEGTALVETEQVGGGTLIRRIRANC